MVMKVGPYYRAFAYHLLIQTYIHIYFDIIHPQKSLLPLMLLEKGSILNLTEKIFNITKHKKAAGAHSGAAAHPPRNPIKPPKSYSSNKKTTLKSSTISLPALTPQPVQSTDTRSIASILTQNVSRSAQAVLVHRFQIPYHTYLLLLYSYIHMA